MLCSEPSGRVLARCQLALIERERDENQHATDQ